MNIIALKTLAKSTHAQILYHRAKDINIRLFNNDSDLSNVQIFYLYFLELYSMLYTDLQMQEEFISEDVINDELRCEAYLLYKKVNKKQKVTSQHLSTHTGGAGSLIFKRGKK
jgi:hypothetical protein